MGINKKRLRIIAVFLSIIMLENIIAPTLSFALTTGPHQQEYAAYESIGATDMVNLVTGDFTYNIPILEVPSPEGGIAFPLSYHAGIELEEEASWVGLGWSLNAGAIGRSVSQYPDDFKGESLNTTITNSGGDGYAVNFIAGTYTHDSEKGNGGSVGLGSVLSFGFGTNAGITLVGVTFSDQYKNGVHIDPVGVAMSVLTIASWGVGSAAAGAANPAQQAVGAINNMASVFNLAVAGMNASTGNTVNINNWTVNKSNYVFYQSYNYHLDFTKAENMYGALYLGNMAPLDISSTNYGTAPYVYKESISGGVYDSNCIKYFQNADGNRPVSDMQMIANGELSYALNPTSIGYDNYNVMGDGVSGSMQPYRHEVGSLAFPSLGDSYYKRFDLVDYLPNKVNFKYAGEIANSYLHHIGTEGPLFNPSQFGIDKSFVNPDNGTSWLTWILKDDVLYSGGNGNPVENDRSGLKNNHLAGSHYITWYNNSEIKDNSAIGKGFIDFLSSNQRVDFRTSLPQNGIGGFSITRSDGMTYHYGLPVYTKNQVSSSQNNNGTSKSVSAMSNSYAVTWLLTAITGSDFVDRGEVGIVDRNDWGYWVKFDYGKFSSDYLWQSPYWPVWGTYSSQNNNVSQLTRGSKETYYLNSISTRSHTALFIKNVRTDGKSLYYSACGFGFIYPASKPSSSLKLNEAVVLKNEDYDQLIKPAIQGGMGLKYDSGNNLGILSNGDSFDGSNYNKLLDKYDFNTNMLDFIKKNQIRRIAFNYYAPGDPNELCKGTLNSFEYSGVGNPPLNCSVLDYSDKKGKLTLKSVSVMGKNDMKVMPDYLFEYGNNPNYNVDDWDGWGMYKSDGQGNKDGHKSNSNGTEWSLNKITTPLGGEIKVGYERDTYNSVSGNDVIDNAPLHLNLALNTLTSNNPLYDLTKHFSVGGQINISGITQETFFDPQGGQGENYFENFSKTLIIQNISSNTISFTPNLTVELGLYDYKIIASYQFKTKVNNQYGGDIRVSSISTRDENGNENISEYIYTQDGANTGISSGVCSVEPEFIRVNNYPFYDYYDYPVTPVMYGKVSVYDKSNNSTNYLVKTEYNFATPNQNMITQDVKTIFESGNNNDFCLGSSCNKRLKMYNYNMSINTASIGNILSVKKFNSKENLLNEVSYAYTDGNEYGNNIGKYTEGSILCEHQYNPNDSKLYYKLLRTTKIYNPSIPKSVTIKEPGITKTITNTSYDYLTGNVLEKETTNSFGEKYKTVSVPAYTIPAYSAMGSKVDDITNKNMLTQEAANYTYAVDASNTSKLISANVQTWSDTWNYRELLNTGEYASIAPVDDPDYIPVWRKYQGYVWKSPVSTDGTISNFADYWSNPTDTRWQKVNEVTQYDHYSKPIEVRDINGNFVSSKMGYNESYAIASVANSNYTGFAYSGAEDLVLNNGVPTNYFGGEVLGADQRFTKTMLVNGYSQTMPVNGYAHTGNFCLKFEGGSGFQYKASVGDLATADFKRGKTYRANVWVYNNPDAQFGALYCILRKPDNSVESSKYVNTASTSTKLVGKFYLLSLDIDIPAGSTASNIEVGAGIPPFSSLTHAPIIYYDDFRVHAVDAPMTSYIYDEQRGLVTAILDNENFATKFYYDNAGRLIRTDKETLQGFKKVSESAYHYGRQ